MNKVKLQERADELQKQLTALQAEIDKPERVGRWRPVRGERYNTIYGDVRNYSWDFDDMDEGSYDMGLVFKTAQEAKDKFRRLKIQTALQDLADKFWAESGKTIDWSNSSQRKHSLHYYHNSKHFAMDFWWQKSLLGQIVFPSDQLSDIFNVIPEEDIKFLMGIE